MAIGAIARIFGGRIMFGYAPGAITAAQAVIGYNILSGGNTEWAVIHEDVLPFDYSSWSTDKSSTSIWNVGA